MKKDQTKNLALRTETVRTMSSEEMANVGGGFPTYCFTIIIPSSGITTLAFKRCR